MCEGGGGGGGDGVYSINLHNWQRGEGGWDCVGTNIGRVEEGEGRKDSCRLAYEELISKEKLCFHKCIAVIGVSALCS